MAIRIRYLKRSEIQKRWLNRYLFWPKSSGWEWEQLDTYDSGKRVDDGLKVIRNNGIVA